MIEHWIWLTQLKGLGPCRQRKLINVFGDAETVYNANESELQVFFGPRIAKLVFENKSLDAACATLRRCEKKWIDIVTINDASFPAKMRTLSDQPIFLYCKGTIKKYDKAIGIVGARKCSNDDRDECIRVVSGNKNKDIAIISGMAIGIDGYAHTAAVKNDMYTIAVLGGGVDVCYPDEHNNLYRRIVDEGLLISEYSPGTRPSTYNFPKRNRIIAALSDELYVIGAKPGSGSLITAGFADKYAIPVHKINCTEDAES